MTDVDSVGAPDGVAAPRDAELEARLLAEATSELATSLDVAGSLKRLAQLVVPTLADWVIVDLADADGRPVQIAMLHRDGMEDVIRRFTELQPNSMTAQAPIMRILAGEDAILVPHAATSYAGPYVADVELLELCDVLGICSAMYVPLAARDRVLGSIALISGRSGRIYGEHDLRFATDLARRAALVVDNTGLYEREHRIAQILQESLLPSLPQISGLGLAASYVPADRGAAVGGDFYDVLALPDGCTGLAVGDVVGHDMAAAAAMGQLRGLLRACAWEGEQDAADPAAVLQRLDRLVTAFALTPFATVFYARARRKSRAAWTMSYAAAGHPAPLLRLPDGSVVELDRGRSPLIGFDASLARRSATLEIPVGSLLVAFTDGLIERKGQDLDAGVENAKRVLLDAPPDVSLKEMLARLERCDERASTDDTAILLARFE